MGLDLFDIMFRIERSFDVHISRDELTSLLSDGDVRVGDIYDHILNKMGLMDTGRQDLRMNLELWTTIRTALHLAADVPPGQVELKTPLEHLFPATTRRLTWQSLVDLCPYRIPGLDYPRAVRVGAFTLAAGMVLFEQFRLWQLLGVRWLWPILGLLGVWLFAETHLKVLSALAPLRTNLPSGVVTVKDLCRRVLATDYARICREYRVSFDERSLVVWQQLTEIMVDALGIEPDEVTFRSRLIRDLGMS